MIGLILKNVYSYQALDLESITTHHWTVFGVSAVTGGKLLNSVDWLINDISKRIFTTD